MKDSIPPRGHRGVSSETTDHRSIAERLGVGRIAIVGTVSIFKERAGRSAYLASFCRVLRAMGLRVDVLFLNSIGGERAQLRLIPDYLDSVDTVTIRNSFRIGDRFITGRPGQWLRRTLRAATSTALARSRRPNGAKTPEVWYMPWPNNAALEWAKCRLSVISPDIVVANYFNASRVFKCVEPNCLKAVLIHDVFALRKQSYEASGYPLDFDERMIAGEAEAFASADLCLAITPEDAEFIRRSHPDVQTAVLPYVIDIPAETKREPPRRCVFVGSDNEPNRRGLAWLVNEVWPLVIDRDPEIRLHVIGTIARSNELPSPRGVMFAGLVDDLDREYAMASVALVPLRAGSGLKVKLIEALAHGVPVVSTTVGAEGVEPGSPAFLRIHDNAQKFAEAILTLTRPSTWAARSAEASAFARAHYSEAAAGAAWARALEALIDAPPKGTIKTAQVGIPSDS